MGSNKHIDLRKMENFVRRKCFPEDILKEEGKKANFRKSCKNFKTDDRYRSRSWVFSCKFAAYIQNTFS